MLPTIWVSAGTLPTISVRSVGHEREILHPGLRVLTRYSLVTPKRFIVNQLTHRQLIRETINRRGRESEVVKLVIPRHLFRSK